MTTIVKGLARAAIEQLERADLLATDAYINGEWIAGEARMPVSDPATDEAFAQVAQCGPLWADEAVGAAARAFAGWRACLAAERGDLLRRWAARMRRHAEDLAVLMVVEQGKPLKEARAEIAYAASFLDWFGGEAERAYGETIPSHKADTRLVVSMQPIGVVAAITPWNFPSAMIARKAGAALAAGCCMIVKPASETPLSALALAKLSKEAGIPSGVFQVITGEAHSVAKRLLEYPEVRALSFTGSTEVGRSLLRQSSDTVKKVCMELGGHAPFIVFEDASLGDAVHDCLAAKFTTSGQDCLAANRIFVHREIYETFVDAFSTAVAQLKVGHGLQQGTDVGPMTTTAVAEKCRRHVADAEAHGARIVIGGGESTLGKHFVTPTVIANATDDMLIANEETFGPVAAIFPFDDETEVVARANATEMGLAAYVYTSKLSRAMRLSERLEYGMVGVNAASFVGPPIPFGGWKQSGLGREGSRHGIAEYMELKYVCYGNLAA